MTVSSRLGLPFLVPGQAQKDFFHNEALQRLDMLVQPAVEGLPSDEPPPSPREGALYLVGEEPSGDWSGQAFAIACWTEGGWRFVEAQEGMEVWNSAQRTSARFVSGNWHFGIVTGSKVEIGGHQVVGPQLAAIPTPAGGTSVDQQGREAISAILDALREHGLIATS